MEEVYNSYLKDSMFYYYSKEMFKKCYGRVPKQRDYTFSKCINYFKDNNYSVINIVELGTSRSFVDGRYPGATSSDKKYWEPKSPIKWDWSAGVFTKYFSDVLTEKNIDYNLSTIDINKKAIDISKTITNNNNKIKYYVNTSEKYLNSCSEKSIDLLYLDTGNLDEFTAKLHLREARILVEKNVLKDDGLILIDDVRNPYMLLNNLTNDKYGKSKYSIPYLLKNNYKIIEDEYQVILAKNNNKNF